MFPNDVAAEAWFCKSRWGGTVACPKCGLGNIQTGPKYPSMPYRCRICGDGSVDQMEEIVKGMTEQRLNCRMLRISNPKREEVPESHINV